MQRRSFFAAAAHGFPRAVKAQETRITVEVLRDASTVHGTNLSGARLQVIQPALERRLGELRVLRSFEIDDAVGPTQGILAE